MTHPPEEESDSSIDLDTPISSPYVSRRKRLKEKPVTKGNFYLWLVLLMGGTSFSGLGIAYYTLHQFNKEQYSWEAKSELRDTLQAEIQEQRALLPELSAEISGKNEERSLKLNELKETKAQLNNARNNLSETQRLEGEASQSYQVLVGKENILRVIKDELEKENADLTLAKSKLESEKEVIESSLINLQSEQGRLKVLTAESRNGLTSIEDSVRENRATFSRESKELSLLQSSLAEAKLVEAEYIRNKEQSGIIEIRLKGLEKTIDSLVAREGSLAASVNQLKKDQANISQDNSDSRELLQAVEARLGIEENKLQEAQVALKRAESDRDGVQALLAKEEVLSLKIATWESQKAGLTASISILEANEIELRNAENAMRVNLATAEKELEEVDVDLAIKRKGLSELKDDIIATDLALKKAEAELRDKADAVTDLKVADEELDSKKIEIGVLGERETNLSRNIQEAQDELLSLKNELKLLSEQQIEIHGDQNEIARLQAIQKDLRSEIQELTTLMSAMIAGISEVKKEEE